MARNIGVIYGILAIGVAAFGTGCATITKGKTDTIQLQVSNCAEPIPCTATNKKGSWDFEAPGPVTFDKSDEDLVITCEDGPGNLTVRTTPKKSSMVWGNVLVGGIIGGGVDASTDAHWETVDSLTINRNYCYGEKTSSSPEGSSAQDSDRLT